jgi:hypothetical protein
MWTEKLNSFDRIGRALAKVVTSPTSTPVNILTEPQMVHDQPTEPSKAVNNAGAKPNEDELKLRAYWHWEKEGRPEGRHLEHWKAAERDLGTAPADALSEKEF